VSGFAAIADDVTGACDVGGEFAAAGWRVRVLVGGPGHGGADELVIVNTQSRMLATDEAAARVRAALARTPADVVLKKIDTALRGHLGAELEATTEALGAAAAFVIPALPAAGRVTRAGRQWLEGRPLGSTEFARDPEGPGAESSIAAVLARESAWPSGVVDVASVRGGRLAAAARILLAAGRRFVVVDAETDDDVARAVDALWALPRPLCLAGSVPVAAALARRVVRDCPAGAAAPWAGVRAPTLVVCGSLHSRAHAQTAALIDAGMAEREPMTTTAPAAIARRARAHLDRGRSVVIAAPAVEGAPTADALRRTGQCLADVVYGVAAAGPLASLVLIGGETTYTVLQRLEADELRVHGRPSSLVAVAEIAAGVATGSQLVTKGGSGGAVDALCALLTAGAFG
jgi:uncharacterized protein YgbK (DUF1537 family)